MRLYKVIICSKEDQSFQIHFEGIISDKKQDLLSRLGFNSVFETLFSDNFRIVLLTNNNGKIEEKTLFSHNWNESLEKEFTNLEKNNKKEFTQEEFKLKSGTYIFKKTSKKLNI